MPLASVFVLAAPGRVQAHALCRASIEASDVGASYTWCENPVDVAPRDHWTATFARMASAQTPYVILLEDDCLVNRHLLHNVATWRWPRDPKFGAGWLYSPGGYKGGHDVWYVGTAEWFGTVAVLYRTADVPEISRLANLYMDNRQTLAWDHAVGWAVLALNRKIRVHGPPIVEHQYEAPSTLGHKHGWHFGTTRGTFKAEWKRSSDPRDPNLWREP